jgi:peptidoglycan-associated lipoprotein
MLRILGKTVAFAVPLFGLLSLTGCPEYPACKKDKHCKQELGEKCVDKVCQNCQTDADCVDKAPEGEPAYACVEFRCGPPGGGLGAGKGEEGDPCTQRSDCFGGLACKSGKCALCTEDIDCSPGTCNPESGRCPAAGECSSDEDCAMDEICSGSTCVFSGDMGDDTGGPCGLVAVFFAFDSDALTPKAQEELTALADCMKQQSKRVTLEAHADNRGTEEYNILLTERRGRTVEDFLINLGVPDANLEILPKGSLEAAGMDESGRSKDRRVQFIWEQ